MKDKKMLKNIGKKGITLEKLSQKFLENPKKEHGS